MSAARDAPSTAYRAATPPNEALPAPTLMAASPVGRMPEIGAARTYTSLHMVCDGRVDPVVTDAATGPKIVPSAPKREAGTGSGAVPVPSLPAEIPVQEALIFEDLLRILGGAEGAYLRFAPEYAPSRLADRLAGPDFKSARALDPSLRDTIVDVVAAAKAHSAVAAAAGELSAQALGRVNNALGAALGQIAGEFAALVAAVETELVHTPDWSLRDLVVHIQMGQTDLGHAYAALQALVDEAAATAAAGTVRATQGASNVGAYLAAVAGDTSEMGLEEMLVKVRGTDPAEPEVALFKGGPVLRLLEQRLTRFSGSPGAQKVLRRLLDAASRPYLLLLRSWTRQGRIDDPFDEFLVREAPTLAASQLNADFTDEYWEKRYTLRAADTLPLVLAHGGVASQVLLAGKYLNVIYECGGDHAVATTPDPLANITSILDERVPSAILKAYQAANTALLRLLVDQHDLESRLIACKRAFFGDETDFLPLFLETAGKDLEREPSTVSLVKLQYTLDMAIAQPGNMAGAQPWLDTLRVTLAAKPLIDELLTIANVSGVTIEQLALANGRAFLPMDADSTNGAPNSSSFTVLAALQLDYQIPFPLSLIITRSSIYRYQFLFRHILSLKTVLRTLGDAWAVQTKSRVWRSSSELPELQAWKQRARLLRTRMVVLFEQLLYYYTVDVIESAWRPFFADMRQAKTVDGLRLHHLAFLDRCMRECFLMATEKLHILAKILRSGRLYGEFLQMHNTTLAWIDPTILTELERTQLEPIVSPEGEQHTATQLLQFLVATLDQFEAGFHKYVRRFVAALSVSAEQDSAAVRVLVVRLEELALF